MGAGKPSQKSKCYIDSSSESPVFRGAESLAHRNEENGDAGYRNQAHVQVAPEHDLRTIESVIVRRDS